MPSVRARITREPIDTARLLSDVTTPSDGAALLFVGVVRNQNDGRPVGSLDYHAYEEMARRTLEEIAREASGRWDTGDISVAHRIGTLAIGEASVAIAVAAPHRSEVYDASRYIIEELKRRVPIWKREGYLDGAREWQTGTEVRAPAEDLP